jgi:hypothetical protein
MAVSAGGVLVVRGLPSASRHGARSADSTSRALPLDLVWGGWAWQAASSGHSEGRRSRHANGQKKSVPGDDKEIPIGVARRASVNAARIPRP